MAKIPISGTYSVDGAKAIFTPSEELPEGTLIEVTLTSGIRGTANQRLASDYQFSFTSGVAAPLEEQFPETTLEGNVGALEESMAEVDTWEQLPDILLEGNVGTLTATVD
jgi:hypothetical protein